MKKSVSTFLIITICFCVTNFISAQEIQDTMQRVKPFKTWIFPKDWSTHRIGPAALYEVKDSSITICKEIYQKKLYFPRECETLDIPVKYIDVIKIKAKSNIRRGLLIGSAIGFGLGYLNAWNEGWDPSSRLFFGGIGAGIGAFYGSIIGVITPLRIPIKGNIGTYNKKMNKIRKYSIKK